MRTNPIKKACVAAAGCGLLLGAGLGLSALLIEEQSSPRKQVGNLTNTRGRTGRASSFLRS